MGPQRVSFQALDLNPVRPFPVLGTLSLSSAAGRSAPLECRHGRRPVHSSTTCFSAGYPLVKPNSPSFASSFSSRHLEHLGKIPVEVPSA